MNSAGKAAKLAKRADKLNYVRRGLSISAEFLFECCGRRLEDKLSS